MDEFRSHGKNLFEALEEMSEWAQGGKVEEEQSTALRNTAALAEMDALMAGLG